MAENYRLADGSMGRIIVARVAPGSDINKALIKIVEEEKIEYGLILGGAASLRKTVLRNPHGFVPQFPINDDYRRETTLDGPLEMVSIDGNISRNDQGKAVIHAHISVSSASLDGMSYGGHLIDGSIVYTTCEIALAEVKGMKLLRKFDDETQNTELYPITTTAKTPSSARGR